MLSPDQAMLIALLDLSKQDIFLDQDALLVQEQHSYQPNQSWLQPNLFFQEQQKMLIEEHVLMCKSNRPYRRESNYTQYLSPSLTLFLTNVGELQVTQESSEEVSRSGRILLHGNTARLIGCKRWCHFNV